MRLLRQLLNVNLVFVLCFIGLGLNAQCPDEVSDFPVDSTYYVDENCEVTVSWTEPSYSLSCDDFDQGFDATDSDIWTLNANGQDGIVITDDSPNSITLRGSTNGTPGDNTDTDFCITIPADGNLSFDWSAAAIGGGMQLINDEPAYTIDGAETQLNVEGMPVGANVDSENGSVSGLALENGQVFCFRVKSNNQGATTDLVVSAFSYEITEINQFSGIGNGSIQTLGSYPIEYSVMDCNGIFRICSFIATVVDTTSPVIACPSDIEFDLGPMTCDSVITFDPITATDNCTEELVVSNISPSGLDSGDAFPNGTTEMVFVTEDESGNVDTCRFFITLNEYLPDNLACIDNNISLDQDCQVELTTDMVVSNPVGCVDNYIITVIDAEGNDVGTTITDAQLGQTLSYSIIHQTEEILTCWGELTVEDKFDPVIECRNDTITCRDLVLNPQPIVTENCSTYDLIMLNEVEEDVSCTNDEISKIIVRTYQAIDAAGNTSEACDDTLYIRKFDVGTVEMPQFLTTLECTSGYATDDNGHPDPEVYGTPSLAGQNLYPDQLLDCNTVVDYDDTVLFDNGCTLKIMRTWTVTTWYCGQDDTRIFNQQFNIVDETAPSITCPADITVTTATMSCDMMVELPAAAVSDACNPDDIVVDIAYPGGFINDVNGGVVNLGVGTHDITYTAYDQCLNSSTCRMTVTVRDETDPVAVCEQFTTVSIPTGGSARAFADSFDDGSFDECEVDSFAVRRMTNVCGGDDLEFKSYVDFCCEDVGTNVMVALRVWDTSGNTNECMIEVEVQDKQAPILIAPTDLTISCEYNYDPENLTPFGEIAFSQDDREPIELEVGVVVGIDGLALDNCMVDMVEEVDFGGVNNCGLGVIFRLFTVTDASGATYSDIQRIDIVNPDPFDESDITWPADYDALNICGMENLGPDVTGWPVYVEDECDQVSIPAWEDEVFDIVDAEGACLKIIRHWKITDWCSTEDVLPIYTYDQVIKVENSIDPVITSACEDVLVETFDSECQEGFVSLTIEGEDDCTGQEDLFWRYYIDLNNDGSINIPGIGTDASGDYEIGVHSIEWILEDACGNVGQTCTHLFEIRNAKAPTAYCINGLSVALVGMDLNQDGELDAEMAIATPDMFDAGSNHICGYEVDLSFSSDVNDTEMIFDCDDIGVQNIEIWVTDINGNQSFCSTNIVVIDSNDVDICEEVMTLVDVTGSIYTEEDADVESVAVDLLGGDLVSHTDNIGTYSFNDMPTGGAYDLRPAKNDDPMNGVSTLDLVIIQKHVLGTNLLESPYQMIAADINHSDGISAIDLVELRKMILGLYTEFPNNTSWRFIDAAYTFPDANNPWTEAIPENYEIPTLQSDMDIDFVGIKIGDVNASAQTSSATGSVVRNTDNFDLTYQFVNNDQVDNTEIQIFASNDINSNGMQFELEVEEGLNILNLSSDKLDLNSSHFAISENGRSVKLSWTTTKAFESIKSNDLLFTIKLGSTSNLEYDETSLSIVDSNLSPEMYSQDGETIKVEKVQLRTISDTDLALSMELMQNDPNPWINQTNIEFNLPKDGYVKIRINDVTGKLIHSRDGNYSKGYNSIILSDTEVKTSGMLIYSIEFEGEVKTAKMIKM